MASREKFIPIRVSMGPAADKLRLSLNLTAKKGILERRPGIRAVEHGYSNMRNATASEGDYPGAGPWHSSGALPRRLNDPNATQGEYDGNNGSDVYSGLSTAADFNFTNVPSTLLNQVANNPTHPQDTVAADQSYGYIYEGIDVEIVQGKVLCMYLTRKGNRVSDPSLYLAWSWHMPGDPMLGSNKGTNEFVSNLKRVSSIHRGKESSDGHGLAGFNRPKLHAYSVASYWRKRIHKLLDTFMITGKGVGLQQICGGIIDAPEVKGNLENDSILFWNSTPLKMMGPPENITTDSDGLIGRTDPFTSIYAATAPRNAFAHTDRLGQTVWYGFMHGDRYTLELPLDTEDVSIQVPEKDISDSRLEVGLHDYDVWYSEINNPASLAAVGIIPVVNGSNASTVVGLAEFNQGTAAFTKDSIQYITGIGSDAESAARKVIHQGVGADARWSIKNVGQGIAFCNKAGIHYLAPDGKVNRLVAFDELFGDGIVLEREPYSDMQGGSVDGDSDDGLIFTADSTADVYPWNHYEIDKERLDRSVGAIWDDLYLLFVSRTVDDVGDDNRLVLVWNWKENTFSTWLLPKHMGVRGWAYDGTLSTPFVMTRYGLAVFDPSVSVDDIWNPATSAGTRNSITKDIPIPVVGQTHRFPGSGEGFVTSHVTIQHTAKMDDRVDTGPTSVGSAYAMHIQLWTQTSEFSIARHDRNTNDIVNAKNLVFQNLYKGSFKGWRKTHASNFGDSHNRKPSAGADTDVSYRVNGDIVRTSVCRSGGHALRHRMQFFTLNHSDIHTIYLGVRAVSEKGRRA